ncbi:huntingtin [Sesbania bispinosa]|nr:huntingtin [Sesbania bispinosa]
MAVAAAHRVPLSSSVKPLKREEIRKKKRNGEELDKKEKTKRKDVVATNPNVAGY